MSMPAYLTLGAALLLAGASALALTVPTSSNVRVALAIAATVMLVGLIVCAVVLLESLPS